MPSAELTLTPSEATQLFEEKVQRLRGEMGHAQRAAQEAQGQRDKALSEVTQLQKEKSELIEEHARLRAESQRIKDGLAEHRKNVEGSLAKQEAQANQAIEASKAIAAQQQAESSKLKQRAAQLVGIKQTLLADAKALGDLAASLVKKAEAALAQIPD